MGSAAEAGASRTHALIPSLCAAVYLAYFDRALPDAGASYLKHELAVSDARLGFAIATAFALAYGVTAIGAALWGGGDGRRTARIGMATWTLGTVSLVFVRSFDSFVVAELVVGAGQALFVPAAVSMIAGAATPDTIGRATARFTVASTLGRSSGVLIGGLMIGAIGVAGLVLPGAPGGWRAIFLIAALPNVILFVLIGRSGGNAVPAPGARGIVDPPRGAAEPVWVGMVGAFLSASAPVMLIQSVGAWMPTLLVRQHGLPVSTAAMLVGIATLIAAPAGQAIGGRLLDRMPRARRRPAVIIAPALAIAAASLAWVAASARLDVAIGAVVVIDLACGMAALAGLAALQVVSPAATRGRTNSLFFALITIVGVGLGPLLVGMLSDAGRAGPGGLAHALGWVGAATVLIAVSGHLLSGAVVRYRRAQERASA